VCGLLARCGNTASFLFYSVCIALLLFDNNNPSNEFHVCSEFTLTGRHSDAVLLKGASNAFLAFITYSPTYNTSTGFRETYFMFFNHFFFSAAKVSNTNSIVP